MSTAQITITILSAVLGTGGIASAIVSLFSIRKYKAEAKLLEQQAEASRLETEQKMNEYIRTQLKELSETYKTESDDLRKQNRELNDKITTLNDRLNQLLSWIVTDNNAYRTWLENELLKLKPDIEFPKCKPAPGFSDDQHAESNGEC